MRTAQQQLDHDRYMKRKARALVAKGQPPARPAVAARPPLSPPAVNYSGQMEDKGDALKAFLANTGPKDNPRYGQEPAQVAQAPPAGTVPPQPYARPLGQPAGVPAAQISSVIPPSLIVYMTKGIDKFLEADGEAVMDVGLAEAMLDSLSGMAAEKGTVISPWWGFAACVIAYVFSILPFIIEKWQKTKKTKIEGAPNAQPKPGFSLRRPPEPAPAPEPARPAEPAPAPVIVPGLTAEQLTAGRDGRMAEPLHGSGPAPDGQVDPGKPHVSDTLAERRGGALL